MSVRDREDRLGAARFTTSSGSLLRSKSISCPLESRVNRCSDVTTGRVFNGAIEKAYRDSVDFVLEHNGALRISLQVDEQFLVRENAGFVDTVLIVDHLHQS